MKILNSETMRKELNGRVRHVKIYDGTARENLANNAEPGVSFDMVTKVTAERWLGSEAREKYLNQRHELEAKVIQAKNAATGWDAYTIQSLAGLYTIDLVRQADDYADYTPVLFKDEFDEAAPENVSLRDMVPYIGKEEDLAGTSDGVPLMQHALPDLYTVALKIRGFGDMSTMRELVFNPFHKTEKVIESAARILADEKNKDSIAPIVSASYGTGHSQTADTTGATYDIKLYNTLKKAIYKAARLINAPTGKSNGLLRHEIYLLVNPLDLMNVQPIVNGNLSGAGGLQQVAGALPVTGIIPYGGGLNDGLPYFGETLNYPGVPQGVVFVFVKVDVYGGYRIVKRNETMEVGEGDVLRLTTEKRAWHRIRGLWTDWVLPSTVGNKNCGAVVKAALPDFN